MTPDNFPPIPQKRKPKAKPIFPDVEDRQEKITFRKDLRKALFDLRETLPPNKSQLGELIVRSAGYISGPQEVNRLPFTRTDGKAGRRNKDDCVAAVISWAIQQGWRFQNGEITLEEANQIIERINEITNKKLINYEVAGNAKGFYLEISA